MNHDWPCPAPVRSNEPVPMLVPHRDAFLRGLLLVRASARSFRDESGHGSP